MAETSKPEGSNASAGKPASKSRSGARGFLAVIAVGIAITAIAPYVMRPALPEFDVDDIGGMLFLSPAGAPRNILDGLLPATGPTPLPAADWPNALKASALVPARGADEPRHTVVEFFDYRCPYCLVLSGQLAEAVEDRDDLRWIVKDWPIISAYSEDAARLALAAGLQGAYWPMHDALLGGGMVLTEANIRQEAMRLDLDAERLVADRSAAAVSETLAANAALARGLGLIGTPAVAIDCVVVAGAYSVDELIGIAERYGPGPACNER